MHFGFLLINVTADILAYYPPPVQPFLRVELSHYSASPIQTDKSKEKVKRDNNLQRVLDDLVFDVTAPRIRLSENEEKCANNTQTTHLFHRAPCGMHIECMQQ